MDLVADIGATNARFQYCLDGELQGQPVVLPTADFNEPRTLLSQALTTLGGNEPQKALLAVAGPVIDKQRVEITNTGLQIDVAEASSVLGCETSLANDFYALAHGVPYFTSLEQIGGERCCQPCHHRESKPCLAQRREHRRARCRVRR